MRSLLVAVFMLSLVIAGCGGSGGGSGGGGLPLDTNTAPVASAKASPEQFVITGSTVTLDGSASTDADGDLLTYAWSFVSPLPAGSTATLSDATAVSPTFTTDVDGSYALSLIVDDGTVTSVASTVLIIGVQDYSLLFLKDPKSLLILNEVEGVYRQDSWFELKITNISSVPFVCTKAEMHNGDSVEGFTIDSALLGGDQIDPDEFVLLRFTLGRDVPFGDFQFRYYLTRPDTGEEFMVFHQY